MFTFFLTILLHKISKSSYFYQAEILHSCGKFKKSTGSQSSSVVAPRMANISTFENLWNLWGGTLSYALFGCLTVLIKALLQWVKEGWGYKNCTNASSLSLKNRVIEILFQNNPIFVSKSHSITNSVKNFDKGSADCRQIVFTSQGVNYRIA